MAKKKAPTVTQMKDTIGRQSMANARLRAENKSLREMSTILKDAVKRS